MSPRRYFSSKGGPYFVGPSFSTNAIEDKKKDLSVYRRVLQAVKNKITKHR